MPHEVLISYSSHDKLQADAICNRLESQGIRCWIAPRDVPVGSEYADSIVQAIEATQVMVLVYSRNADASEQVKREVERAVSAGIHIMPVRIENAEMSKSFEYYVGSIHWLDAITPPFEAHIDKLAQDLKAVLEGGVRRTTGAEPPAGPTSPAGGPSPAPTPAPATTPAPAPTSAPVPPKKRRTAAFAGVAVVLAAVAAVVGYVLLRGGDVVVQSVADLGEAEAVSTLEDQGFVVVTELAESEEPGGEAIETDPGAGEKARQGSQITLRVSGMVTVPAVVGLQEADARQELLRSMKFGGHVLSGEQIAVEPRAGGEVEGEVLESEPAAGQRMLLGSTVTLYVAGARVGIPNVADQDVEEARRALEEAQLQVEVVNDWEAGPAVGTVLRTNPEAGAEVDRQSTVQLFVVGRGGWIYENRQGLEVGQVFTMRRALTRRTAANSSAQGLGALAEGTVVRVLAPPTGDGWVKVVVN